MQVDPVLGNYLALLLRNTVDLLSRRTWFPLRAIPNCWHSNRNPIPCSVLLGNLFCHILFSTSCFPCRLGNKVAGSCLWFQHPPCLSQIFWSPKPICLSLRNLQMMVGMKTQVFQGSSVANVFCSFASDFNLARPFKFHGCINSFLPGVITFDFVVVLSWATIYFQFADEVFNENEASFWCSLGICGFCLLSNARLRS